MARQRRPRGWGGLLPDGRFRVTAIINGRRRTFTQRNGETQTSVRQRADEAKLAASRGTPVDDRRLTIRGLLERWASWIQDTNLHPHSIEAYEASVRNHLLHPERGIGYVKVADLKAELVQTFLRREADAGYYHGTINHALKTLRVALHETMDRRLISADIGTSADRCRIPRNVPKHEKRAMTRQQRDAFLRVLSALRPKRQPAGACAKCGGELPAELPYRGRGGPRKLCLDCNPYRPERRPHRLSRGRDGDTLGDPWPVLFTVAVLIGLRKGEALGLRWGDIDLEAGKLRVEQQVGVYRIRGAEKGPYGTRRKLETSLPKLGKKREAPLPATAVRALRQHRDSLPTIPLPSSYVFARADGRPLVDGTVNVRLGEYLKAAGLVDATGRPMFTVHELRHTAYTLARQDLLPADVRNMVGHASDQMGLVYDHPDPTRLRIVAETIEAGLAEDLRSVDTA